MDEAIGWAVAAGVCYAAYKLVFGSSSSSRRREVSQVSIDQVLAVFPLVSQGAARWELERNGGSVERAVERALREGGLPEPPASYFPPPSDGSVPAVARPATPTPVTPARGASTSAHVAQGPPPSLIKRMGLQAKVAADDHEQGTGAGKGKEADGSPLKGAGWSPDASQREQNLRARKEKLVLEARRKLLEKQQRKKEAGEAPSSPSSSA